MNEQSTPLKPSLWNRNFIVLWIGLIQSNFGDAFLAVGALWLVYQITGSAFAASTILILEGLPKLLGLVAGAVIDRSDKKHLLIIVDLFRGVLLVFAYGLRLLGRLELWHIYVVVGLLNAASVFYTPTVRSVLPTIVPNDHLARANALVQTGQQAAKIIGAGVAGWVLASTQSTFALFVDGISFLIAAVLLCFVHFPIDTAITRKREARQLLADVGAGIRFITTSSEMSRLLFVVALVNVILGPVNVALPVFSNQVLGDGVISLGYLEAALAGGMLFGGLVTAAALGDRLKYPHIITIGIWGLALALLLLGFVQSLIPAIVATATFTSFIPLLSIGLHTRVQRLVPIDFRGRVFASIDMIGNIALPIGAIIAGGLLERLYSSQVFMLSGVCIGLAAFIWMRLSARYKPDHEG